MFRVIQDADWSSVDRIQQQAYAADLHESLAVLQQKAELSPDTCFVFQPEGDGVLGYCLSHYCPPNTIPALDTLTAGDITDREHLFLHDMALDRAAQGQGVAGQFLSFLVQRAEALGIKSIGLVAVQGSAGFWQKQGFIPCANEKAKSYGADARYLVRQLTDD